MPHPWKHLRSFWSGLWATWSCRCLCSLHEVGLDELYRSLPTQGILWFQVFFYILLSTTVGFTGILFFFSSLAFKLIKGKLVPKTESRTWVFPYAWGIEFVLAKKRSWCFSPHYTVELHVSWTKQSYSNNYYMMPTPQSLGIDLSVPDVDW